MIVLLVIGILMGLAVPNFISSRRTAQGKTCFANLRAIEAAKEELATERGLPITSIFTIDSNPSTGLVGTTSYLKSVPLCPSGGIYTVGTILQLPTCSAPGHSL